VVFSTIYLQLSLADSVYSVVQHVLLTLTFSALYGGVQRIVHTAVSSTLCLQWCSAAHCGHSGVKHTVLTVMFGTLFLVVVFSILCSQSISEYCAYRGVQHTVLKIMFSTLCIQWSLAHFAYSDVQLSMLTVVFSSLC
jgi:hypothetical protein